MRETFRDEAMPSRPGGPLRIILHGKQASNLMVREAVQTFRDAGYILEVRVTWEAGDAARLVREAVADRVETVVAAGGDGTINEVATGLIEAVGAGGRRPSLGVLPLGTANDFAGACGIPLEPLEALRLITTRAPSPIDVGRVGSRVFINVATGGFGTEITVGTPEDLKSVFGSAAYLLTGLTRFSAIRAAEGRFTGPDFSWSGAFLVLAVGNGRQAGGGHVLCPQAYVDDGLLDLRILPTGSDGELGTALWALLRDGIDAVERAVVSAKLPWLEVEAPVGLNLSLDGEPLSGTSFRFEVVPKGLCVHLPERSPVLAGEVPP